MPSRETSRLTSAGRIDRTSSRQTAYASDCQSRVESACRLTGWDPKITRLFDLGQRFLGCEYSEPGWLYRGGASGLKEVLKHGELGHFDGEKSVTRLEHELGIYLVSQDFSDAYSVARFWEAGRGAYIAVFQSRFFNRELYAGRAAVLGFAEPGVVFKYPFLTHPVKLSDINFLIVSPEDFDDITAGLEKGSSPNDPNPWTSRIISSAVDPEARSQRMLFEKALTGLLENRGVKSAVARPSSKHPRTG